MALGRHSGGLALTRPVSPRRRRFTPLIGLSRPLATSRQTRLTPVAVLSSGSRESR